MSLVDEGLAARGVNARPGMAKSLKWIEMYAQGALARLKRSGLIRFDSAGMPEDVVPTTHQGF